MKYSDIRESIRTGDVIGVEGISFGASITRAVQKLGRQGDASNITHIAIAYWIGGRLFVMEMDGKYNVLRPLSQHAQECKLHIYDCPSDRELVEGLFDKYMSATIHYSQLDNIKTGLRLLFNLKQKDTDSSTNCSIFGYDLLVDAGWYVRLNKPSPSEMCNILGVPKFITTPEENVK